MNWKKRVLVEQAEHHYRHGTRLPLVRLASELDLAPDTVRQYLSKLGYNTNGRSLPRWSHTVSDEEYMRRLRDTEGNA